MTKRKKKQNNSILYLIIIIILTILSAFGIQYVTEDKENSVVNVANPENLQNVTIKTGSTITKDFVSDNQENLKVYFFDVGQADSILVMNKNQTMLIDAENNEDGEILVENLRTLGVTKIDYLIGTHPHEDHIGGLDNIIKNFEIGTIYMPKVQTNTKTFEDVLDAVAEKNLSITTPKINDTFSVGESKCKILSVENNSKDLNSCSIVIQMKFDTLSYLFMGDAEEKVEKTILEEFNNANNNTYISEEESIKANILKVGHHGSDTSSSENFLKAVAPEIAVISVGIDNSYGHPNQIVLDRLNQIGSKIYRTDEVENIFIEQMKE